MPLLANTIYVVLKQYSITQPEIIPKLVATLCFRLTQLNSTNHPKRKRVVYKRKEACVIEYCFSIWNTNLMNVFKDIRCCCCFCWNVCAQVIPSEVGKIWWVENTVSPQFISRRCGTYDMRHRWYMLAVTSVSSDWWKSGWKLETTWWTIIYSKTADDIHELLAVHYCTEKEEVGQRKLDCRHCHCYVMASFLLLPIWKN